MGMKRLLIALYYDGKSLKKAKAFIKRAYQETPTDRQIKSAQKSIKDSTGKDWK